MFRVVLLTLSLVFSFSGFAVDLGQVEEALLGEGVIGWIHGADHENRLYVFTYRNPENFFDNQQFSLVPRNSQVFSVMRTLKRHDRIRVRGRLQEGERAQPHIWAEEIVVEETWQEELPDYHREVTLPDDLQPQGEMIVKVHALVADGRVMVVDYKGTIVPVVVEASQTPMTQNLFRGDKVRLNYVMRERPNRPTHVSLDPSVENPVQVLDSILAQHGRILSFEGDLVMFPESPQIIFNVFAIQVDIGDGLVREYTLVNFEDPDLFQQIREKLQQAWDASEIEAISSRNKLLKKGLRVRGTGPINVIDPNQANPQILLDSVQAIEILD